MPDAESLPPAIADATGEFEGGDAAALSGYAVRFNLRHRRAGPLFQGRYRAVLAGEEDCITEANRYIHLNPVRLESLDLGKQRQAEIRRGIEDPADEELVRRRLELLRGYTWSSYWAYAGYIKGPAQLRKDDVLGCFEGRTQPQQRKFFRDYTENPIREGVEVDQLLERIRYGVLLGSQEWTAKMRMLLSGMSENSAHWRRRGKKESPLRTSPPR